MPRKKSTPTASNPPAKTKEDIIAELKAHIASDPQGAKEPFIGGGSRTYSMEDILAEIEKGTELGQQLVANWLELSHRSTKKKKK